MKIMNTKNTLAQFKNIALPLFALGALTSSCLGDKTEQDYLQDQANQQAAQLQGISGTYNGKAVSSLDQSTLGAISLSLRVNYNQIANGSANAVQEQAVLSGSVTFNGAVLPPSSSGAPSGQINPTIPFNSGTYDPASGHITATFAIENGSANSLQLEGYISGGAITGGKLIANGYDGYGVDFSAEKNGSLPATSALTAAFSNSTRLKAMGSQFQTFVGSVNGASNLQFALSISSTSGDDMKKLYDLLAPIRPVIAEVWLVAKDGSTATQITFPAAALDDGTEGHHLGTLSSSATFTDSAGNTNSASLHCDAKRADGPGCEITGWSCTLTGSGAVGTSAPNLTPGALPEGALSSSDLGPISPNKN